MKIIKRETLKQKPSPDAELGFGHYFTDYMFTMKYTQSEGWHDPMIEPNEPQRFDLGTSIFHYAQGIFEGMKAFIQPDGSIAVFRPEENWARMNRSAERMCIPQFPADVVEEGLEELLKLEKDWIPTKPGTALYIRPTIVATRVMLGVHASTEYLFFIILSPVGSYYAHGLEPTKLLVEDFYVRSAIGGTGEAKCLGNYAASMKAGEEAEKKGFDQVLWLDAKDKKYVEEVGSGRAACRCCATRAIPSASAASPSTKWWRRPRTARLTRRSARVRQPSFRPSASSAIRTRTMSSTAARWGRSPRCCTIPSRASNMGNWKMFTDGERAFDEIVLPGQKSFIEG